VQKDNSDSVISAYLCPHLAFNIGFSIGFSIYFCGLKDCFN